tara:strand:+ start:218 stop:628 length:411 start_codon:yes stop_codon:yes gene_type:complete
MENYKGDKRSKQYKQWKKNHEAESNGLGDKVEKVFKATGIDKAAKFLLGEDCGCDERKKVLNHIFPYQKPLCLTEDEYNYLTERIGKINTVAAEEQKELLSIYNRIFKDKKELTSCGSCFLNGVWKKLERIYKEYS